jgi:glutamate synthase domain-containing protein 1
MCGIAGILYKSLAEGRNQTTGQALIDMLDGCQHRGPDSTGFALYGDATDDRLRLRFFIGTGDEAAAAISQIKKILAEHQAEIVDDEVIGNNYRVVVNFSGEMWKMAYDLEHVAKVISIGTSLEIIKDVGSAHDVDDRRPILSGRPASATSPSSTTARSQTIGRCAAASSSAATSSTPTTTAS